MEEADEECEERVEERSINTGAWHMDGMTRTDTLSQCHVRHCHEWGQTRENVTCEGVLFVDWRVLRSPALGLDLQRCKECQETKRPRDLGADRADGVERSWERRAKGGEPRKKRKVDGTMTKVREGGQRSPRGKRWWASVATQVQGKQQRSVNQNALEGLATPPAQSTTHQSNGGAKPGARKDAGARAKNHDCWFGWRDAKSEPPLGTTRTWYPRQLANLTPCLWVFKRTRLCATSSPVSLRNLRALGPCENCSTHISQLDECLGRCGLCLSTSSHHVLLRTLLWLMWTGHMWMSQFFCGNQSRFLNRGSIPAIFKMSGFHSTRKFGHFWAALPVTLLTFQMSSTKNTLNTQHPYT